MVEEEVEDTIFKLCFSINQQFRW